MEYMSASVRLRSKLLLALLASLLNLVTRPSTVAVGRTRDVTTEGRPVITQILNCDLDDI